MTLVKWTNHPVLNEMLGNRFMRQNNGCQANRPAANISETENEFLIELAAPGMKKENFNIDLDKDILNISTKIEEKEEKSEKSYNRMEFNFQEFCRSFTLPETIDRENIQAEYKDGILNVILPKQEEVVKNEKRKIDIA